MKQSANQWSDWSRALYNVLYFAKFLYVSCDMYRLLVGIEIIIIIMRASKSFMCTIFWSFEVLNDKKKPKLQNLFGGGSKNLSGPYRQL